MSGLEIDIDVSETLKSLDLAGDEMRAAAKRGLVASGLLVQNEMKRRILKGPKTGKEYRRRSITHRASADGEAPANDTGTLVRSIASSVPDERLAIEVSAGADYARHLEFGTRHMGSRPFMRVSADAMREKISDAVARAVKGALDG